MLMRRRGGWLLSPLLMLCSCSFDTSTAHFSGAGDSGPNQVLIDASAADAQPCPFDSIEYCDAPDGPLEITEDTTLDTDNDPRCRTLRQVSGRDECLLLVQSLVVEVSTRLRATGDRPLRIVALGSIEIFGRIDVGSFLKGRGGAGYNSEACLAGTAPEDDTGGAAGGAGGSFIGLGGNGGEGDTDSNGSGTASPGVAGAVQPVPSYARGGCSGADGGDETPLSISGKGGRGGRGGGAVSLISGIEVHVHSNGIIRATGAGGRGGGAQAGGGGGGSGGYISITAPTIISDGFLTANGGGGGEGGYRSNLTVIPGRDGANGTLNSVPAAGGSGASATTGNGGTGSAAEEMAGGVGEDSTRGAGGGGGAAGYILLKGTLLGEGESTPAAMTL